MCFKKTQTKKEPYLIENGIRRIWLPFIMLTTSLSVGSTVFFLYKIKGPQLIADTIKPSIYINLDVIA